MLTRVVEVRRLTTVLFGWSTVTIADGGGLSFADSGELLWGITSDSQLPRLPLLDSLFGNEIGSEAHLLGHSKVCGVISNDDVMTNSGEATRSDIKNREIG
jgi:hypothetical protein